MNRQPAAALMMTVWLVGAVAAAPVTSAQEGWRPFDDRYPPWGTRPERREPERQDLYRRDLPPPRSGPHAPQPAPMAPLLAPIERSELPPVISSDGSGLPFDLWTGIDLATAEQIMAGLELPPLSPALMGLWRRLMNAAGSEPAGASTAQFTAVRAEALYRSGQLQALGELFSAAKPASSDPLMTALSARYDIAVGRRDTGCSSVRDAAARKQDLPRQLGGEMLVLAGFCAAAAGNTSAASLAAELAREEGVQDAGLISALNAIASGGKPRLPRTGRMTPTHYRLLQLANAVDPAAVIERADAALLSALVLDPSTDERLRVAAAEAAARLNVIDPESLANAYRAQRFGPGDLARPLASEADPLFRRALLLQAAEAERHPVRLAQILRAFVDDARRAGLYYSALAIAAPLAETIPKAAELAWFGETAVEAALVAGNHAGARAWWTAVTAGRRDGDRLEHWLALSDIANADLRAPRGLHLPAVEALALHGGFSAPVLHRLATVLDALDYQVPMQLWHAASSTPQPNDGHLPETGVLTELKEASSRKQFARTVLLVMKTLGPKGAEGAHMIALGDAIRALKRVGLEADARQIGFEALFGAWPRSASH